MPLNQTAYVILGLLSIEPNLSGYDMRKMIRRSVGYFWGESYGQIYPTLKRLVAAGLIAPGSSVSTGRKRRQTYILTEPGRGQLRQWLALPFQNDPPRNEFLLKLFFGREAAPGVSIAHVRDLQERNQRALATLEEIEASAQAGNPPNPHFPYWMLTLGLGKALTQAALEWGETALNELSALEGAAATTERIEGKRSKEKAMETDKPVRRKDGSARAKPGGAK
jgi:DNA-binding PadR family transcriptional regulator